MQLSELQSRGAITATHKKSSLWVGMDFCLALGLRNFCRFDNKTMELITSNYIAISGLLLHYMFQIIMQIIFRKIF